MSQHPTGRQVVRHRVPGLGRFGATVPDRIAFVHIPKTAGRSVIHAFEQALGVDQCSSFSPAIDAASFAGRRFVAGHVQLSQTTPDAYTFTFLREPVRQLASHLRWLDRYNLKQYWQEVAPLSDSIRQAVRRLDATDFASPASLQAFFDWLPDASHARLRDVQCEVLAARADVQCYATPAEMAAVAIRNLGRVDFVGLCDGLDADLPRLFRGLGLRQKPQVTQQNTRSSNRRIDLAAPGIAAVLAGQVQADLALYRHVLDRRAAQAVPNSLLGRLAALRLLDKAR